MCKRHSTSVPLSPAGCDRAARRQFLETLGCTCEPSHEDAHCWGRRFEHVQTLPCHWQQGQGREWAFRWAHRMGVVEWEWGKLRPPAELTDVHKVHDLGQWC
jgi:hypothetical protein